MGGQAFADVWPKIAATLRALLMDEAAHSAIFGDVHDHEADLAALARITITMRLPAI